MAFSRLIFLGHLVAVSSLLLGRNNVQSPELAEPQGKSPGKGGSGKGAGEKGGKKGPGGMPPGTPRPPPPAGGKGAGGGKGGKNVPQRRMSLKEEFEALTHGILKEMKSMEEKETKEKKECMDKIDDLRGEALEETIAQHFPMMTWVEGPLNGEDRPKKIAPDSTGIDAGSATPARHPFMDDLLRVYDNPRGKFLIQYLICGLDARKDAANANAAENMKGVIPMIRPDDFYGCNGAPNCSQLGGTGTGREFDPSNDIVAVVHDVRTQFGNQNGFPYCEELRIHRSETGATVDCVQPQTLHPYIVLLHELGHAAQWLMGRNHRYRSVVNGETTEHDMWYWLSLKKFVHKDTREIAKQGDSETAVDGNYWTFPLYEEDNLARNEVVALKAIGQTGRGLYNFYPDIARDIVKHLNKTDFVTSVRSPCDIGEKPIVKFSRGAATGASSGSSVNLLQNVQEVSSCEDSSCEDSSCEDSSCEDSSCAAVEGAVDAGAVDAGGNARTVLSRKSNLILVHYVESAKRTKMAPAFPSAQRGGCNIYNTNFATTAASS